MESPLPSVGVFAAGMLSRTTPLQANAGDFCPRTGAREVEDSRSKTASLIQSRSRRGVHFRAVLDELMAAVSVNTDILRKRSHTRGAALAKH